MRLAVQSFSMPILDRLRDLAPHLPKEVRLLVLFGSTARGEAGPRSDVDLGVLLDPYSAALRFKVDAELGRAVGREVDTVLLDDAPPLLRFEITKEGVLLLEREEGLWTHFKAKAMVDWWDWASTFRMMSDASIRRLREKVADGQG